MVQVKSTLIKMLLGFLNPSRGKASVFGLDVQTEHVPIRQQVGYMPEDECLIPEMTAVQIVAYAAELCGMPARDAMQRAHEVLYYVGIDEERYRPVREYSTGMRQRVKLAQALVHDPKLLLLDEPTNGMDTAGREEMLTLVKDISVDKGIDVILSSHLLPDIESACHYVIALSHGSLAISGEIESLRKNQGQIYDLKIVGDRDVFVEALKKYPYDTELRTDGRVRVTSNANDHTDGTFFFRMAHETGVQLRQFARG